jgi:hypothetical protein
VYGAMLVLIVYGSARSTAPLVPWLPPGSRARAIGHGRQRHEVAEHV